MTAICFDRPWMCKRSRSRRHSRGGETAARHALTDTVAVSRPVAAPSDVIYGTSIPLGCYLWDIDAIGTLFSLAAVDREDRADGSVVCAAATGWAPISSARGGRQFLHDLAG